MTTLTAAPPQARTAGTSTAVTAAGLAGAVASAGVVAGWFLFADLARADATRTPLNVVGCLIEGVAFAVLAVALPGLAATTKLPRWVLGLAALAAAFVAVPAWAFGTVVPHLAGHVSDGQFDDLGKADFSLMMLSLPMQVLGLVGFVALAVVGWRRRAFSRGAAVLLAVAGLSALTGEAPLVGILAGVALAWAARSVRSAA